MQFAVCDIYVWMCKLFLVSQESRQIWQNWAAHSYMKGNGWFLQDAEHSTEPNSVHQNSINPRMYARNLFLSFHFPIQSSYRKRKYSVCHNLVWVTPTTEMLYFPSSLSVILNPLASSSIPRARPCKDKNTGIILLPQPVLQVLLGADMHMCFQKKALWITSNLN